MKYCAAYYSDIGIQKETNQDSLLLVQRGQTQDDEAVLAVICDGVGGLKMGERSSAAVVTAFRDWFYPILQGGQTWFAVLPPAQTALPLQPLQPVSAAPDFAEHFQRLQYGP